MNVDTKFSCTIDSNWKRNIIYFYDNWLRPMISMVGT